MPKKNNLRKKGKAFNSQHKKERMAHMQPAQPKQHQPKHATMHNADKLKSGGNKLRTVQVSNERALRVSTQSSKALSEMAAVGVLDPFCAYAHQYKTGLPFSTQSNPAFGFWTRSVTRCTELQWGTTATAGVNLTINPWNRPQFIVGTSLDASGIVVTVNSGSDPQNPFILANFENLCVAYQGVRVRNLTAVLSQSGELTIGNLSNRDATTLSFDQVRASATTITHANGDPGVLAQCAYVGNQNDQANNPLAVSDYRFSDTSFSVVDEDSRCISIRSMGTFANPQIFEVEIVTYFLGTPFSIPSQIFAPVRYEVNPVYVNRLIDEAYVKAPQYSIPRNFIKDDGWDTLWTGVKAIVSDIGLGLIGSAASAIGSAFSSLFSEKKCHLGMKRILLMLPPDAYAPLKKLIDANDTHEAALSSLEKFNIKPRFTQAELAEISDYMGFADMGAAVPAPTAPADGPAKPAASGWFAVRKTA